MADDDGLIRADVVNGVVDQVIEHLRHTELVAHDEYLAVVFKDDIQSVAFDQLGVAGEDAFDAFCQRERRHFDIGGVALQAGGSVFAASSDGAVSILGKVEAARDIDVKTGSGKLRMYGDVHAGNDILAATESGFIEMDNNTGTDYMCILYYRRNTITIGTMPKTRNRFRVLSQAEKN